MFCVSIAESGFNNILENIKGVEMAEIRLEKADLTSSQISKLFETHSNLIATCRAEGLTNSRRLQILKTAIDSGAAWIDIEIESEDAYLEELRNYAKAKGCRVIISYHNYEKTPDNERLNQILIDSVNKGADLVKIATQVVSNSDSARLLSLYQFKIPILAIGMGSLGKITRIAALEMGAPFTFVRANNLFQTAPGQLSESQTKDIINVLNSNN